MSPHPESNHVTIPPLYDVQHCTNQIFYEASCHPLPTDPLPIHPSSSAHLLLFICLSSAHHPLIICSSPIIICSSSCFFGIKIRNNSRTFLGFSRRGIYQLIWRCIFFSNSVISDKRFAIGGGGPNKDLLGMVGEGEGKQNFPPPSPSE